MCFFCSQEFVSLLIWSSQVFKIKFQIAQFVTKKITSKVKITILQWTTLKGAVCKMVVSFCYSIRGPHLALSSGQEGY